MLGGYAKRYRVKPRFYLILLALLGLAVWLLLYLFGAFREPKVEWGKLSSDQKFTAIVLRDEQLIQATEYSKLSCLAAEGQQVAKDANVAMLYLSGYSDTDVENLAKLRNTIKDYQENSVLKSTVNKGLEDFNNSINDKLSEISAKAISRQTQDLAVAEADLREQMQKRKDYMFQIVNKDDTLNRYYDEEAALVSKIDQTRKTIPSPADGFISYYLDGYENELTVGGIDKMTPAGVKALLEDIQKGGKTFNSSETVDAGQPICRIVNPSKWYALIVMSTRENPFVQGMDFDMTFGGLQNTVSGKVVKLTAVKGNELVVLEVPDGVQNMLSLRVVTGHLGQDKEGFRVPVGMLKDVNGKNYVAVKGLGGAVKRVEVEVRGKDDKYAIIADIPGASDLDIGLPLVKP